ncbi:MAG TPA: hypothetical protein DCE56_40035 [Cyanobacteria bacterium UBA8553]|nr:hypothetical protein [Cyanobacteria bacterium UBA8553]HAJ58204.1 hypothetical protein [Cyanobacteria bacterium UBA8543]
MNSISFRLVSFLLGLVALTVVSNTKSALAETPNAELSVELSEPAAAAAQKVMPTATSVPTSESVAADSSLSVAHSQLVAETNQEFAPTVTPVTASETLETHSTVSLEPPKPTKVSLREVKSAKTPAVTSESLENHSTVSVESPKLAAAPVQAVEPSATPIATNQPQDNHSTASVELPKLAAAPVQAVEPSATPIATDQPQNNHSTISVEIPKPSAAPVQAVEPAVTADTTVEPLAVNPTFPEITEDMTGKAHVQPTSVANFNQHQPSSQKLQPEVSKNDQQVSSKTVDAAPVAKPIPGTLATSAALLTAPSQTSSQPKASSNRANSTVAQTEIQPGQATRGGRSYIGIGGNIGFGDTGIGSGAFVINSKIGLTSFISVRPAILFGDDVNFLIPVTYDFTIESDDPFAPVPFAPFVGGGVVISSADDNNIGFLLTGGVDVPLSREFVANATLNIGFLESSTDVGLTVGVGYTFPNFIR